MDSASLISLISFASIVSACGAVYFGVRDLFTRKGTESALKRELRQLPRLRDGDAGGVVESFDIWFERTLYMANTGMTPLEGVLLVVLVVLTGGGLAYLATSSELLTLLAVVVFAAVVFTVIVILARRRLARFEAQFPMALDLLARAVRAGESFEQALTLVGEASEEPVRSELKRCARQIELGLAVPACMHGLSQRVDLMDVRIFANAVAVHRESGGNLSVTLERLSEVIRDRHSYHRQLRSVTGAGRMSTIVISSLGPLLFAYLFLVQPDYGHKLVQDPMGQWMLAIAVVLEVIGIVWVLRLLKPEY